MVCVVGIYVSWRGVVGSEGIVIEMDFSVGWVADCVVVAVRGRGGGRRAMRCWHDVNAGWTEEIATTISRY